MTSAFAYADLATHALVLRVALVPYPALLRTRAFWSMTLFGASSFCTDEVAGLVRLAAACVAILLHQHYCITVGTAIADALGIKFFVVPNAGKKK